MGNHLEKDLENLFQSEGHLRILSAWCVVNVDESASHGKCKTVRVDGGGGAVLGREVVARNISSHARFPQRLQGTTAGLSAV